MLRPTYINKFSITLVYNFRYTLTVGGNLHHDLIRQFGKEDAENSDISYVINENHNRENHWFVAITAPWQPLNWLNLNASFIGVRQDIRMYREDDYFGHFLYFANANATVLYRQTIRWKHNIMELAGCIPVIAGSILVIHSTCTCAKMERRALCSYFGGRQYLQPI